MLKSKSFSVIENYNKIKKLIKYTIIINSKKQSKSTSVEYYTSEYGIKPKLSGNFAWKGSGQL